MSNLVNISSRVELQFLFHLFFNLQQSHYQHLIISIVCLFMKQYIQIYKLICGTLIIHILVNQRMSKPSVNSTLFFIVYFKNPIYFEPFVDMAIREITFSCIWWWWKGGMEIITKSIEVELDYEQTTVSDYFICRLM